VAFDPPSPISNTVGMMAGGRGLQIVLTVLLTYYI
jgi:hypothetical protein